jgi:V-type H+-transporting ATPase subunit a
MTKLGSLHNYISFENLNKEVIESQKPYYSMIQRCEELEKILDFLNKILCEEFNLNYEKYKNYEYFKIHLDEDIILKEKKFNENYFDLIENEINEDYKKIKEQSKLNKSLTENYLSLLEYRYVLEKIFVLFSSGEIIVDEIVNYSEENIINNKEDKENNLNINYIAGLCNNEDRLKISKIIFRKGKDRAVPNFFDIKIRETNPKIKEYFENKVIFLVCIQGDYLINQIKEVLTLYNCSIYNFPHNINLFEKINEVNKDINEKKKLISEGHALIKNLLASKEKINNFRQWNNIDNFAEEQQNLNLSEYHLYLSYLKMQKLIYQNLNKCLEFGQFYIGEVWIPEIYFSKLQEELKTLLTENERIILPQFDDFIPENNRKFPTYFRTNEFNSSFQEIVSTYGIPRYKEANPGIFSIVSFPFLFGVMFGDIGHGTLIFILASYMCLNKNNIMQGESLLKQGLKYRYFLLLMGFFSLFCGLMYNDMMALPLSFFNSCYETNYQTYETIRKPNCVYPVGIDPKWYSATNDLSFLNSFKMKWSVIIGVIQMMLGIVLRGMNNIYFKEERAPQSLSNHRQV